MKKWGLKFMRFVKETIAMIFIIVFILVAEVVTNKIIKESVERINEEVSQIQADLNNQENLHKDDIYDQVIKLENEWKEEEEKLSYFAEHEELEKVSTSIVLLKSNIASEEIANAAERVEELQFRIEHIKNKQKLKWNNIM